MKYKMVAKSRRFPPDYKCKWYVFLRQDGKYLACERNAELTLLTSIHNTLNEALDKVAPVKI
jgi:hypothetical protein